MTNTTNAGQSAIPTETLNTLVVKNTTSPDEKSNGSMNYTLITTVSEILEMNIIKNLRIGYGNEESSKKPKPIHKEIEDSFIDEPTRFIQRHTGFAVLCDAIKLVRLETMEKYSDLRKFFDKWCTNTN